MSFAVLIPLVLTLCQGHAEPVAHGPVARVNGEELPFDGFEEWLVRTHGWRHIDDFVDLALMRQEARRQKIELPGATELEATFEQDWKDQVMLRFRGDEAAYLEELKKSGMDKNAWRDRRLGTLEQDLLGRHILQLRPATDQNLKDLFAKEFGKEGIRTHVRVAFFDKLKKMQVGQAVSKERSEQFDRDVKSAAGAFLEKVKADRSLFAQLVASDSDLATIDRFDSYPIDIRSLGGEVARLRADHFGGVVSRAVADAKSGELLGPIQAPSGYYVIEVIDRTPVTFEATQEELRRIWHDRAPSPGEVHALKQELREAAQIERFPLNAPAKRKD